MRKILPVILAAFLLSGCANFFHGKQKPEVAAAPPVTVEEVETPAPHKHAKAKPAPHAVAPKEVIPAPVAKPPVAPAPAKPKKRDGFWLRFWHWLEA